MSDTTGTVRTDSDLLNEFRDGQPAGSITPQDVRDIIASMSARLSAVQTKARNAITSGPYTLSNTDNGTMLVVNSSAAITVNVPTGLTAPFDLVIVQAGTGQVTIAAASGSAVHIHGGDTLNHTAGQYASVTLSSVSAVGTDVYILAGDVA